MDWRKILRAYIKYVGQEEGADFLIDIGWPDRMVKEGQLTQEELDALLALAGEASA